MTRDFAKHQLARIQAFWPSLGGSSEAVDEFMRALKTFSDAEVDGGITRLIDTHAEPSAPKPVHIIASVRAQRPKTYETATEEERDLHWPDRRREEERQLAAEFAPLEEWLAGDDGARARYEAQMMHLLQDWPVDKQPLGRRILHRVVLRWVHRGGGMQGAEPRLQVVR